LASIVNHRGNEVVYGWVVKPDIDSWVLFISAVSHCSVDGCNLNISPSGEVIIHQVRLGYIRNKGDRSYDR